LKEKTLPYLNDVGKFLKGIAVLNDKMERRLALSSTPEYNDNSIKAWFLIGRAMTSL
jgi:alpha-L-fucosidase 2